VNGVILTGAGDKAFIAGADKALARSAGRADHDGSSAECC
jgi:enoyl-CoA hydratase/carnithine racemase